MNWQAEFVFHMPIFAPPHTIISHAGYLLLYPQNTILGCREAVGAGANGIEIDLRRSLDGIWCLCHEKNLATLTNGTGTVNMSMWEYLSQLDAGYIFNGGQYAGREDTKLPSFESILNEFLDTNILLYLDMKEFSDNDDYNPNNLETHSTELIQLISSKGMLENCIFHTPESLANELKTLHPQIRTVPYYWGTNYNNSAYESALVNAVVYGHEGISWPDGVYTLYPNTYITRTMVEAFAKVGVKIGVGTLVSPSIADKAAVYSDIGVNEIATDDPVAVVSRIHADKIVPIWNTPIFA